MILPPQAKIALGAASILGAAWGGWYLRDLQVEAVAAAELRAEKHRERLADDVAKRTERALGSIRIENQVINNEVQREIRTRTVYRDCVLPADGVRLANEARARAGQPDRAVPRAASAAE